MSQPKKKREAFVLPEHPNAEPHRKLMEQLKTMSDEAFFGTLVKAGIYDKKGNLKAPYADESPATKKSPARAAAKTARAASK
jgi:hypothetical protein